MIKCKCVPFIVLLIVTGNLLYGQAPIVKKAASWSQRGYYILNAVLARNAEEAAFVRKWSGKDSSITSLDFLKDVDHNYLPKSGMAQREHDPVISLFNFKKANLSLIDYGWSPAYSTNDNRIAYAFQLHPLQKQDKLYAASYKGNTIKLFNKSTLKIEEVAKPLGNYLLDPFFSDSLNLVYKAGDKVNGPYGAAISLNEVNLKNKKKQLVQQAAIKYRLYQLVGETYLINKELAYVVYSPADSGTGMASEYQHLLMSRADTIQDFGVRKFTNLTYKFAFNDNKELLFLDDQHFLAEDTNYLVTYKGDQLVKKQPLNFTYNKAYLSPNGKYMLYFTQAMDAFVINLNNFNKTKIERPQKELHAMVWGADSNSFALVQDHEKFPGTDEMLIYNIK